MKTRFAENFSAILKIKDISQTQFAKLYGVKQNTVSQWANGKREPNFNDLCCICALLDMDIKELLGFNERTKEVIRREIIGGNDDFQREQKELQDRLSKEGKSHGEIIAACNELYKTKYEQYKRIFGFND